MSVRFCVYGFTCDCDLCHVIDTKPIDNNTLANTKVKEIFYVYVQVCATVLHISADRHNVRCVFSKLNFMAHILTLLNGLTGLDRTDCID